MKNSITSQTLVAAMHSLPAKDHRKQWIAHNYYRIVCEELRYGYLVLADGQQIKNNTIPFSISRVRKQLGAYGKNPKKYWWDWLHANFPLVNIISTGNSIKGTLSMATTHIPLDVLSASTNEDETVRSIYERYPDAEYDFVPIDQFSLNNFIRACEFTIKNKRGRREFLDKTEYNRKEAKLIQMCANQFNGNLPQVISHSSFGRKYYKGPNLQSTSKIVRHAALGSCWEVDINNSVYAWKYAMMKDGVQNTLTYTREYIQDKDRIRKRLAQLCFGNTKDYTIDTIKQVLTAISFGARSSNETTWCVNKQTGNMQQLAIHNIIKSQDVRTRLFADEWMHNFVEEQKQINKLLSDELFKLADEGQVKPKVVEMCSTASGRRSRNKFIAYAYQQSEKQVTNQMIEVANCKPTLIVHDAIYFKTKPDIASMSWVLQNNWALATVTHTHRDKYVFADNEPLTEHERHMENEERAANNGELPTRTQIKSNVTYLEDIDRANCEPNWNEELEQQTPRVDERMPDYVREVLGL